jgi:hypothetical protein
MWSRVIEEQQGVAPSHPGAAAGDKTPPVGYHRLHHLRYQAAATRQQATSPPARTYRVGTARRCCGFGGCLAVRYRAAASPCARCPPAPSPPLAPCRPPCSHPLRCRPARPPRSPLLRLGRRSSVLLHLAPRSCFLLHFFLRSYRHLNRCCLLPGCSRPVGIRRRILLAAPARGPAARESVTQDPCVASPLRRC